MLSKLITAPASAPVSLAEAKLHLRVDASDEDALITGLIAAATDAAEQETGRALITQTWEWSDVAFPDYKQDYTIVLTKVPLQSVTSVKYYDASGVLQTLDPANYTVVSDDYGFAKIVPAYGYSWPVTRSIPNAVIVRYVAGYANVPEPIKQWIKLLLSSMFDNRETESYSSRAVSTTVRMQFVDRLLDRYRVLPL